MPRKSVVQRDLTGQFATGFDRAVQRAIRVVDSVLLVLLVLNSVSPLCLVWRQVHAAATPLSAAALEAAHLQAGFRSTSYGVSYKNSPPESQEHTRYWDSEFSVLLQQYHRSQLQGYSHPLFYPTGSFNSPGSFEGSHSEPEHLQGSRYEHLQGSRYEHSLLHQQYSHSQQRGYSHPLHHPTGSFSTHTPSERLTTVRGSASAREGTRVGNNTVTAVMPPGRPAGAPNRPCNKQFTCPACGETGFTSKAMLLNSHIKSSNNTCVILPAHRVKMVEMGMQECSDCHQWFANLGVHTQGRNGCGAGASGSQDDEGEQGSSDEEAEVNTGLVNLTSEPKVAWLESLDWQELCICPYSTLSPTYGIDKLYQEAHEVCDRLMSQGKHDLAFKAHFLIVRCVFAPSEERASTIKSQSLAKLFKSRLKSFCRGEWETLWEAAKAAPRMGNYTQSDTDIKTKEDNKVKELVMEGELSKAMAVYDSKQLLDPGCAAVKGMLDDLHPNPAIHADVEDDPLPDEPAGLHTDDMYEYELENITIKSAAGEAVEVPSVEWVQSHLKRGIAQGLSGARYEHYKIMQTGLLKRMVDRVLNGRVGPELREVLSSGRGLALDKGTTPLEARPIAIGEALRRIATRVMLAQDGEVISQSLKRVMQWGVGVPSGIDYAYHAVRMHLQTMFTEFEMRLAAGEQPDEDEIPAALKADFKNGYNNTLRSKFIAQVQEKFPHTLRFVRSMYAQIAKVKYMRNGEVVHEVDSVRGSMQGDPMGSHLFALSIYDFAEGLLQTVPTAMVTFIIDDLTISDTQAGLVKAADYIHAHGPEYGLIKHPTKGSVYSPYSADDAAWTPDDTLVCPVTGHGYRHDWEGFDKLLGAPLGEAHYEDNMCLERTEKAVKHIGKLARLQDTQIEFVLLKYCYGSKITYLSRMVEPETLERSLHKFDSTLRKVLDRMVSNPRQSGSAVDDIRWKLAKLPIKNGGLGLQDIQMTAPAQHMATLGQIYRMAKDQVEEGYEPASKVLGWYEDNDELDSQMRQLATQVNGGDSTNPICPTIDNVGAMPKAKKLVEPLYATAAKAILRDPSLEKADKAFILSNAQMGAGEWTQAIPSQQCFRAHSMVYKDMLQERLCINPNFSDTIEKCGSCGKESDLNMLRGRHWGTVCKCGFRIDSHDKLRDQIRPMYQEIRMKTAIEVGGLYKTVTENGQERPADILVVGVDGDKNQALDITIRDPSCDSYVARNSWKTPLVAAKVGHDSKIKVFQETLIRAGAQGLNFTMTPLAFETSGAMGKETVKWFESMVAQNKAIEGQDREGISSRMQNGLPNTWTANSFGSYWKQRISFFLARDRANKRTVLMGQSQPRTDRGWTTGG